MRINIMFYANRFDTAKVPGKRQNSTGSKISAALPWIGAAAGTALLGGLGYHAMSGPGHIDTSSPWDNASHYPSITDADLASPWDNVN